MDPEQVVKRQHDHKYVKYILPVLFFIFVLVWTKSKVKNQQNGLILIGSQEDIGMIKKYIKVPVLEYRDQKWRHNNDKHSILQAFSTSTQTFRVLLVMNEEKLLDVKATYIRQLISQLNFLQGLENYLVYVDIYITSSGKRDFHDVSHYLNKLAKQKTHLKYNHTLELVVNLLFNLKNSSLNQQLFFAQVQKKVGLKSSYLSLKNGRLDVGQFIMAQSELYLLTLRTQIQNGSMLESKLVSMYYSACNDEKEKLQAWLVEILDKTVAVHFTTPRIYEIYRKEVKRAIRSLDLEVRILGQCQPPLFERQACQRQFFSKAKKGQTV